jgi:O-antigen/teichoic acid export membrane protein
MRKQIAEMMQIPPDSLWLYVIPIAILCISFIRILEFRTIRNNQFGRQSIARVSGTAIEKGGAVGLGLISGSIGWLLVSKVIGLASSVFILSKGLASFSRYRRSYTLKRVKFLLSYYSQFFYVAPSSLLSSLSREVPYLMLAALFSPAVAGYIGLARNTIGMPLRKLSHALNRAFYHRVMKATKKGESLQPLCVNLLRILILSITGPIIIVFLLGDELVPLVFGERWVNAGQAVGIVCLSFFGATVFRPISVLFDMLQKQRQRVYFGICLLTVSAATIYIGSFSGEPLVAMKLYVFGVLCLYSWIIIYLLSLAGMRPLDSLIAIGKPVLYSICGIYLPVAAADYYYNNLTLSLLVAVLSMTIFYSLLYFLDNTVKQQMDQILMRVLKRKS